MHVAAFPFVALYSWGAAAQALASRWRGTGAAHAGCGRLPACCLLPFWRMFFVGWAFFIACGSPSASPLSKTRRGTFGLLHGMLSCLFVTWAAGRAVVFRAAWRSWQHGCRRRAAPAVPPASVSCHRAFCGTGLVDGRGRSTFAAGIPSRVDSFTVARCASLVLRRYRVLRTAFSFPFLVLFTASLHGGGSYHLHGRQRCRTPAALPRGCGRAGALFWYAWCKNAPRKISSAGIAAVQHRLDKRQDGGGVAYRWAPLRRCAGVVFSVNSCVLILLVALFLFRSLICLLSLGGGGALPRLRTRFTHCAACCTAPRTLFLASTAALPSSGMKHVPHYHPATATPACAAFPSPALYSRRSGWLGKRVLRSLHTLFPSVSSAGTGSSCFGFVRYRRWDPSCRMPATYRCWLCWRCRAFLFLIPSGQRFRHCHRYAGYSWRSSHLSKFVLLFVRCCTGCSFTRVFERTHA